MIGQAEYYSGIIAKMSGSTERNAQGREASAEVDRQAKFVDDPLSPNTEPRRSDICSIRCESAFTIKVTIPTKLTPLRCRAVLYVNKGLLLAADNEAEPRV